MERYHWIYVLLATIAFLVLPLQLFGHGYSTFYADNGSLSKYYTSVPSSIRELMMTAEGVYVETNFNKRVSLESTKTYFWDACPDDAPKTNQGKDLCVKFFPMVISSYVVGLCALLCASLSSVVGCCCTLHTAKPLSKIVAALSAFGTCCSVATISLLLYMKEDMESQYRNLWQSDLKPNVGGKWTYDFSYGAWCLVAVFGLNSILMLLSIYGVYVIDRWILVPEMLTVPEMSMLETREPTCFPEIDNLGGEHNEGRMCC